MDLLKDWVNTYNPSDEIDLFNAKREIVQEIVLAGLYRGGFFEKAVFYGGTALRVLYGLDRYSEDLDFCLLQKNLNFTLSPYLESIRNEFELLGLEVEINIKKKATNSAIESAFLKENSEWSFLEVVNTPGNRLMPKIKIKIEVDRDPPLGYDSEPKLLIRPYSFYINSMVTEDLFAGKMHAALFRNWQTNVKGRDWYDLQWHITRGTKLNLLHFRQRVIESVHWSANLPLFKQDLLNLYHSKVNTLNIEMAKKDIIRFINDPAKVNIWSKDFFHQLADHLIVKDI